MLSIVVLKRGVRGERGLSSVPICGKEELLQLVLGKLCPALRLCLERRKRPDAANADPNDERCASE